MRKILDMAGHVVHVTQHGKRTERPARPGVDDRQRIAAARCVATGNRGHAFTRRGDPSEGAIVDAVEVSDVGDPGHEGGEDFTAQDGSEPPKNF
jgi:hypothetical protein